MRSYATRAALPLPPLQWPGATGPYGVERSFVAERLLKAALVFAMLSLTVLDRFGLQVSGEAAISSTMIALYALAAVLVVSGAGELNARVTLAYLAVLAMGALSLVANWAFAPPPYVSPKSFLLMAVTYAPLCLSSRKGAFSPQLWRWTVNLYVGFATFVAAAGIVQYFTQFVFSPPWLFDFTPLVPERILNSTHWATVHFMGGWIKSNGFFMREPAFFSILMAFGLICELRLRRRKWVMSLLLLGLLLSYSGSGLLCLAVAMLFPLGRGTLARIATFAVLGLALFLVFGDALHLSYTLGRVDEFSSSSSSAYCRFIYPATSALRQIDSHPWTGLIGHGPGSITRMGGTCSNGFETAFAKSLFEYGMLGAFAFAVLVLAAIHRSGAPGAMRAGAAITWLVLGGLFASDTLLFIYLISALWPEGTARGVLAPGPAARESQGTG